MIPMGMTDARSNLLDAIRHGTKLRKVEEVENGKQESAPMHDVASILARRCAMQYSSSEHDSDSESSGSDWDETN